MKVKGKAILFQQTIYHRLVEGDNVHDTLKILDVCGAPAQVKYYAQKGQNIIVLGAAGKSGILSCIAAKEAGCYVIAIDSAEKNLHLLMEKGFADQIEVLDITLPQCYSALQSLESDFTISCVNVPDAEMAAVLPTKNGEKYFFNMATSFSKAVLGAEGIAKDIELIMGNGYKPGHAEYALELARENRWIYSIF